MIALLIAFSSGHRLFSVLFSHYYFLAILGKALFQHLRRDRCLAEAVQSLESMLTHVPKPFILTKQQTQMKSPSMKMKLLRSLKKVSIFELLCENF